MFNLQDMPRSKIIHKKKKKDVMHITLIYTYYSTWIDAIGKNYKICLIQEQHEASLSLLWLSSEGGN